ncbi:hypothetical protein OHB26_02410 [Nocardia sp. NBC_01503]|uniref:hypothetical protein n=1 Tax=Nocardia sp. NBC_01503 TaxID=2975997 RepID=UPI002E7B7AC6|nr:hypothetical protein [Nocardia sp. NBC_01503]WTL33130.1 hypothetical protein OHB26_02410 [Nocardia sp. NBC_01503]
MINLVLILAVMDIAAMTVLIVIYWIPPLYRRLNDIPLIKRYWRESWGGPRVLIPLLVLAGIALLGGLMRLANAL